MHLLGVYMHLSCTEQKGFDFFPFPLGGCVALAIDIIKYLFGQEKKNLAENIYWGTLLIIP